MSQRFYLHRALQADTELDLDPGSVRHLQVIRAQPGDPLVLFNGEGLEWQATVLSMGRSQARIRVQTPLPPVDRELPWALTLALVMPANERMDAIIEKATELGVSVIQPLLSQRSVVRLSGDRALKRRTHWQAVAASATEQCGRTYVPQVLAIQTLSTWSTHLHPTPSHTTHWLLCAPRPASPPSTALMHRLSHLDQTPSSRPALWLLSGPEGGWTPDEEAALVLQGWGPTSLGPRTLRADTAPLAALATVSALACTHG